MDLSQKVLSAKTFLKKSLLEDLLLLNEDVDPDSRNNVKTNENNKTTQTGEETLLISKIKNIIFLAAKKNTKEANKILGNSTEFKNKNGEMVGRTEKWEDIDRFKESRLKCVYGYLVIQYPKIAEKVKNELEAKKNVNK